MKKQTIPGPTRKDIEEALQSYNGPIKQLPDQPTPKVRETRFHIGSKGQVLPGKAVDDPKFKKARKKREKRERRLKQYRKRKKVRYG